MFGNIDRELTINFIMMLLGIGTAIWNVFIFIATKKAEKAAMESEDKALKYAEQANEYYKITVAYYEKEIIKQDIELEALKEKELNNSKAKQKENVLRLVNTEGFIKTSRVATMLGLEIREAYEILIELLMHDRQISSGGNPSDTDYDQNIWTKKG